MDNFTLAKCAAYDPSKIYEDARAKAKQLPAHPLKDMPQIGWTGRMGLTTPNATNWDTYSKTMGYLPNSGGPLNFVHNMVRSMYARPSDRFRSAVSGSTGGVVPWSTLSRLYAGGTDMGRQYGMLPKAYQYGMQGQNQSGGALANLLPILQMLA